MESPVHACKLITSKLNTTSGTPTEVAGRCGNRIEIAKNQVAHAACIF
ncbi:hypothetical protein ALP81_200113 [Pseudomonas savastanoi pv. fraxini]|nr:hypothetical protein ALP81_200113 [Pseudomonas savastanoi pv. fraxini]